ncbi:Hypothetical predicted protein [Paramuricea clavata]|uniref:Uncharacterized protein n=1 Tax=Paramuricea clavata TaxID=317549 RepID=A0A7D9D6Z9_PARCT|nr:Hypothetical predicted protein [Paramuricea clavata]
MAMASASDCIYNVQLRSLVQFIHSPNPSTGRLRHCHLSFNKVTVEHITGQVVNLRILDLNGEPVCANGNQIVISRHEDPVPDYTISLGNIPLADHTSDARGVFCHVYDFLHKQLEMSNETIGQIVSSSSSDCEATYTEQAAEGDNEICGHLKNLVSPLFLSTLLLLADVFSRSAFTSEAAQSDLYPLWDDKANVDKFIENITKINEMPVLENPLNRRLCLQYPSIEEGNFTPNFSKPDQQVNILQHDVQFQPRVRHRPQPLTPDDIIRTTEDRLNQLTSAILREAPVFLAMGEQEENVIKMFDVKSFDYHSSESLCEQNNNEFISFAKHLNRGNLSFPRHRCCEYIAFKERVRDNKERFKNFWFVENEAHQITWNTSNVLCCFQKTEHGLHEGIPDLVEIIKICLVMSRSQSDIERFGKLAKDVSEKRFCRKFNETHQDQNKRDRVTQETFIYDDVEEAECKAEFRVLKQDLPRLREALRIPANFKLEQRSICNGMEGLCMLLRCVCYPCRYSDIIPWFGGRPGSVISFLTNHVIDYIFYTHGYLISEWNKTILNPVAMQSYADAIAIKGTPLDNGRNSPSNLLTRRKPTIEGRRHDAGILAESGLLQDLENHAYSPKGQPLCIYGDLVYPLRVHLQTPFPKAQLRPLMHEFNRSMSQVRIAVEWLFGDIANSFKFTDYKKNLKISLSSVGKMYVLCALLRNAITCLYGNQTSEYFDRLDPPTLEEYFQ